MIFDKQNMFSDGQAVTVTAASENVVAVQANVGAGEPVYASAHVVEAFAGLTSIDFQLQSATAESGPWSTIAASGAVALADLNSGKVINLGSIPPRTGTYLRLNYVAAGTGTAGKITAGIVWDRQTAGTL